MNRKEFIKNIIMALLVSFLPKILLPSTGEVEEEITMADEGFIGIIPFIQKHGRIIEYPPQNADFKIEYFSQSLSQNKQDSHPC